MSLEDEWGQSIKDAKPTHEEVYMQQEEGGELVRCGSTIENPEETVYGILMKNKTEGVETITFAKKDWVHMETYLVDIQNQIIALSQLTPVKDAHGLCKVTTCQWNELSVLRDKANKDAEKLKRMYTITDDLVQIISQLIAEKLVAAEGWWHRKFTKINQEIEDLKHS